MSDDIKNWMHLFRWIVKYIRDEYGIDEGLLNRTAVLEEDLGIDEETIEEIIAAVAKTFSITFPEGTLNEVLKLEELCLLSAWMHGLYKQPEFLGVAYVDACRALERFRIILEHSHPRRRSSSIPLV
jgi:hypothetical protein